MASKNHSPTRKNKKREVFGLPLKKEKKFIVSVYALPPVINPDPLIAVIIITVKRIRTTIAVITIKIGNQSVTELILDVVSLITSMAVVSVVASCNSPPIKAKIITRSPITNSIVTTDNKIVNPATPLSVLPNFIFF